MEAVPISGSIGPFLETRSVWVAICGRPEQDGCRVWIHSNSTFGDIKQELASIDPLNLSSTTVLQSHFGHRTYWSQPDPATRIGDTCRIIYAVATSESEPYLLAMVRSPQADYPLMIAPSHLTSTVYRAIIAVQPNLTNQIQTIADYSGNLNIGDNQLDFQHHISNPSPTFPTVFFLVTNEGPFDLLSGQSIGYLPPLLQTPKVHCEHLLRRAKDINQFRSQTTHLLQAACHITLTLGKDLKPLVDARYSDLEDVLITDGSLTELLPVSSLLAHQITRILHRIEVMIRAIESGNADQANIKEAIDLIFDALCGDFPGAVAVRQSKASFTKLSRQDDEALLQKYDEMGPPDDYLTMSKILDPQTRIMDALKDELGGDHPDTLKAGLRVASTYMALGHYSEAKKLLTKTLKRLKKRLGENNPDTLSAALSLALTYTSLGRFNDAQELASDAVSGLKATMGEEHPDTYRAILNLAWTYHKRARNVEAESLLIGALEGLRMTLGQGHPDTLNAARQLSLVYAALGRYSEAEALQKQSWDGLKNSLGPDHRESVAAALELASIYCKQGRYLEAMSIQIDSLPHLEARLGEAHPDTIVATINLAETYCALGSHSEAQALQMDILKALETTVVTHHAGILAAIHTLALVYKSTTARRLAREVHRIQQAQSTDYILVDIFGRLDPTKKGADSDAEMDDEEEGMDDDTGLDLEPVKTMKW